MSSKLQSSLLLAKYCDDLISCKTLVECVKLEVKTMAINWEIDHGLLIRLADTALYEIVNDNKCNHCKGTGFNKVMQVCQHCNGSGIKRLSERGKARLANIPNESFRRKFSVMYEGIYSMLLSREQSALRYIEWALSG